MPTAGVTGLRCGACAAQAASVQPAGAPPWHRWFAVWSARLAGLLIPPPASGHPCHSKAQTPLAVPLHPAAAHPHGCGRQAAPAGAGHADLWSSGWPGGADRHLPTGRRAPPDAGGRGLSCLHRDSCRPDLTSRLPMNLPACPCTTSARAPTPCSPLLPPTLGRWRACAWQRQPPPRPPLSCLPARSS